MMDRTKIASIIRALLSKTTENGATEAEAMSAAEKAREFMDRYRIDQGEVGMAEEGVATAESERNHYKTMQLKDRIAMSVAAFCDCKCWKGGSTIKFFGLRSDADFAVWLVDNLDAFIRKSAFDFITNQPWMPAKPRWEAEKAFVIGACMRIHERLTLLAKERREKMAGERGSRSLVVVKNAVVTREFAKLNLHLRSGSRRGAAVRDNGAFGAGKAAGDRASFWRPVNAGGAVRMIGSH